MSNCEKAKHISKCLQLAILLEVSSQKPGNVSFAASFEKTRVEHFLASSVAASSSFQEAAYLGTAVAEKRLDVGKAGGEVAAGPGGGFGRGQRVADYVGGGVQ